jgi:hypothetical protein
VAAVPAIAGAVLVTALAVAWYGRLPDPVATHMNGAGEADGFTSRAAFAPVLAALTLLPGPLFGVLTARMAASQPGQRALAALGCGTAGFLTCLGVRLVGANADAPDASSVTYPPREILLAAGAFLLAAGAGWLLAGRPAAAPADAAAPPPEAGRAPAADGETLVWTRYAGSRAATVSAVLLVVAAVPVGLFAGWAGAVPLVVTAVVLAPTGSVRATADASGFTVSFGPLPRPRVHIPAARIERAGTRRVRALRDFGGWGYRVVPGVSAVVLRSGEAVELRLAGGSSFVVTVDDAETAARVVNTLAARSREAG